MSNGALRVAHVITHLDIGGAETALARLIENSRAGVQHAVWSLRAGGRIGEELRSRVSVSDIALQKPAGAIGRWRGALAKIRDFDPHVLQGWMYHGNVAANFIHRALRSRPALAWNVRGSLRATANEKFLTRRIMACSRWFARRPRCIVNNSRVSAADHIALGYPERVWRIIPNGFDTARFRPRDLAARTTLRQSFGLAPDARIIGTLGRNHPIKGHARFIEACARLAAQCPRITVVLAGPGWEPDGIAARRLPPLPGVEWHCFGALSNAHDLLPCLDVFCLPSLSEGFPNALGEAMSCGVPSVATDAGDTAYLLGATGVLVPPDDVPALAAALERLLSDDPGARAALGRGARERIESRFRLSAVVDEYQELYSLLAGGRAFRADC